MFPLQRLRLIWSSYLCLHRRSFSNMENEMTSYSMVRYIYICSEVMNQWGQTKSRISWTGGNGACDCRIRSLCSVAFACGNRIICVHKFLSKCLVPEGRYLNADIGCYFPCVSVTTEPSYTLMLSMIIFFVLSNAGSWHEHNLFLVYLWYANTQCKYLNLWIVNIGRHFSDQ